MDAMAAEFPDVADLANRHSRRGGDVIEVLDRGLTEFLDRQIDLGQAEARDRQIEIPLYRACNVPRLVMLWLAKTVPAAFGVRVDPVESISNAAIVSSSGHSRLPEPLYSRPRQK